MTTVMTSLATVDNRPFFDKTLHIGVKQGITSPDRLQSIQEEFSKGIVQIANFFGRAYLRPELELARLLVEDGQPGHVRGQQVRRELDAAEGTAEAPCDGLGEHRLQVERLERAQVLR